jgi:hypothetical protein
VRVPEDGGHSVEISKVRGPISRREIARFEETEEKDEHRGHRGKEGHRGKSRFLAKSKIPVFWLFSPPSLCSSLHTKTK